ncbi:hypothetical protein Tco_0183464 [Tanacetum coccineum]
MGGCCWDDDDGEMMAEVEVVLRCADDGVGGDGVVRIVAVVAADKYGLYQNHKEKHLKRGMHATRGIRRVQKEAKNLSSVTKQSKVGQT